MIRIVDKLRARILADWKRKRKEPRPVSELRMRRMACDSIIRFLSTECADDPRQPETIEHYRKQQAKLDAELAEAEKLERKRLGIPEPPDIVVNLQTAILFPRSEKIK